MLQSTDSFPIFDNTNGLRESLNDFNIEDIRSIDGISSRKDNNVQPIAHLDNSVNSVDKEQFDLIENDNDNTNSNTLDQKPIKLINFTQKNFELNPEALDLLRTITEDIVVVSIVGKARTGKSYLMNLLLNNQKNGGNTVNNGFEVASTINSCTRGIWLWNTPKQKPNSNSKIIFIDSEGTNSVDLSTKTYDSKIFALVVLISSLFIYNTTGNIDERSIGELALAAHLSNSIATDTKNKDEVIRELAPKFIWVLRDFTLDKVDPETGEEISSNEYLEICLRNKISGKNSNENNIIRENIVKYFTERECVTLSRPIDEEIKLQKLNTISFDKLKSNFREEFLSLKHKVYQDSKPKRVNGRNINGPKLVELLISFVNSINKGIVPNINTAWDSIIKNEIESQYNKTRTYLKQLFKSFNTQNTNSTSFILNNLFKLKYNIIQFYNKIIQINPEIITNSEYNELYLKYKNEIEQETDKEIIRTQTQINAQNNSTLRNIINQHVRNINNKIFNDKYLFTNKFNDYIWDYNEMLNGIKNNVKCSNKESFALFAKNDVNHTRDILFYMVAQNKLGNKAKINEIEKQLKIIDMEIHSKNSEELNNINQTYMKRISILNKDLLRKEQEIDDLSDKYLQLKNEKDKIKYKAKNDLAMSIRVSTYITYLIL